MRDGDYLVGHHRSHGHLIAAGADIRRMMAEMFGKRTGYCKGLGGSMHISGPVARHPAATASSARASPRVLGRR
jgi:TPP-dependent pyruvate/acetoin dehydrogenase alpha subunit